MNEISQNNGEGPAAEADESMNTGELPSQSKEDTARTGINKPDTGSQQAPKNIADVYSNDPKRIIKECVNLSFNEREDIINFCSEYSDELCSEIRHEDGVKTIKRKIWQHCYRNACYHQLWQTIEVERPNQYNYYHPMWEKYKHKIHNPQFSRYEEKPEPIEDDVPLNEASKSHPLSSDDDSAILNWFYNDLDEDEKSLVLTVGLFQGLNRKYIPAISDEIRQILFESSDGRKEV